MSARRQESDRPDLDQLIAEVPVLLDLGRKGVIPEGVRTPALDIRYYHLFIIRHRTRQPGMPGHEAEPAEEDHGHPEEMRKCCL